MRKALGALIALVLVLAIVEGAVHHHEQRRMAKAGAITETNPSGPDVQALQNSAAATASSGNPDWEAANRCLAALKTSDDMRDLIRAGRDWELVRMEIVNDTHPSPESLQSRLSAMSRARDKIASLDIQDTCAARAREAYLTSIDARILAYRKKAENRLDWYQAEQSALGADAGWSMAQRACIES
jgi:hypothetical protein